MPEERVTTKAELLRAVEHTWAALHAALDRLSARQMTTLSDAHGWTVKDHIIHMTAWERSVVFFVEAFEQFRTVHQHLVALLQPLTDADLQNPYRSYLPDEPGEGDGPPAINVIYGNTAHHFTEHLTWIQTRIAREAAG